jgi:hypothetical protein
MYSGFIQMIALRMNDGHFDATANHRVGQCGYSQWQVANAPRALCVTACPKGVACRVTEIRLLRQYHHR